jgi:parallel beta-helix repeat protein
MVKHVFIRFFGFLLLFFILLSFTVLAVECGKTPTDGCSVTQTTTFTKGTYSLPNGIHIDASDLTLDCSGATLLGSGVAGVSGIVLLGTAREDITIKNCNVSDYAKYGVEPKFNLSHSVLDNNDFSGNTWGLRIENPDIEDFASSFDLTIQNNGFVDNAQGGLSLLGVSESLIQYNTIDGGQTAGIHTEFSSYNVIDGNTVTNTDLGIYIIGYDEAVGSTFTNITSNYVDGNNEGICLGDNLGLGVNDLVIAVNDAVNNNKGINLIKSSNNEVYDNTMNGNSQFGMVVGSNPGSGTSNGNLFYRNNFFKDSSGVSAADYGINDWNTSKEGNFWSDYTTSVQGCKDENFNNICDDPYNINSGSAFKGPIQNVPLDHLPKIGTFASVPPPLVDVPSSLIVDEGETTSFTVNVEGAGPFDYVFTQPDYLLNGNTFTWQTNFTDADVYGFGEEVLAVQDMTTFLINYTNITVTVYDDSNTECSTKVRNSCTVSVDTVLPNNKIYNFKDGIRVTSGSLFLDCQHSVFDGEGFSYVSDGIKVVGQSSVILNNCGVRNYDEGLVLSSSPNTVINGGDFDSNNIGITVDASLTTTIKGVKMDNHLDYGIYVYQSDDVVVKDSLLTSVTNSGSGGIVIEQSDGALVSHNLVSDVSQGNGIWLRTSDGSKIRLNLLQDNTNGIRLESSTQSVVKDNFIANNLARGMLISSSSSNNKVYHNNFVNNPTEARDSGTGNSWDYNNEGNFWSDYNTPVEGCFDIDANGICDDPRPVPSQGQDNFPFKAQYGWGGPQVLPFNARYFLHPFLP